VVPRARELSGLAVASVGIGGLFVWGGVKGVSPLATLQAMIKGSSPTGAAQSQPITQATPFLGFLQQLVTPGGVPAASAPPGGQPSVGGGSGTDNGGGPATGTQPSAGDAIASYAKSFVGAGYQFGGAPANGPGHWDCSSFVNWIVGHLMGLPIPGYAAGHYTGTSHGPISLEWDTWSGCTTIGHSGAAALPGDLCCWQTHMGIAIGGGQMVSARSASSHPPTGINTIDGDIPGEALSIRRLKVG